VLAAGLSAPVVATAAVPLDVTTSIAIIVVGIADAEGLVAGVVSSASIGSGKTLPLRWPRAWRPLAATLLTRAHLPPRGDIAPAITCARCACSDKETPTDARCRGSRDEDHPRTDIPVDPEEPTTLSSCERASERGAMTERTAATRPSKAGAGTRRL